MQRIPKAIVAAQLTTSAASYYAAPTGTTSTVNNLSFTNTSGSPVTVTLYCVPSAGSPAASNTIMSAFSLSAGQTYVPPQAIGLQLEAGMTLQALASANTAVTIAGGVYETSGS
ncbi:hypothetical protein UA18_03443 [Burkholderia multivorans]|uniref:Uncharacterized protein n=1 Tax=Burkholderia multivorans TaxID=87883 RepID=A0ABD7L6L4_9BURK|nr:hypothetical protein [Burkholderia multivorans]SAJ96525.1 hypothetical protein UA18_03443 [Burkholderia multivorans]